MVSLHVPLSDATRHLIDAEALGRMRDDAYLVNTARGPVVDEAALAAALRDGVIAGAALDVFEHEPEVHPDLVGLDNVVLVPHLGSATRETRDRDGRAGRGQRGRRARRPAAAESGRRVSPQNRRAARMANRLPCAVCTNLYTIAVCRSC